MGTVVPLLPALLRVLPRRRRDLQLQLLPLHRVRRHGVAEVRPQPALPLGLGAALMDDVGAGAAAARAGGLQERQGKQVGSNAVLRATSALQRLGLGLQRRRKAIVSRGVG